MRSPKAPVRLDAEEAEVASVDAEVAAALVAEVEAAVDAEVTVAAEVVIAAVIAVVKTGVQQLKTDILRRNGLILVGPSIGTRQRPSR